jgi:hypothetical protein
LLSDCIGKIEGTLCRSSITSREKTNFGAVCIRSKTSAAPAYAQRVDKELRRLGIAPPSQGYASYWANTMMVTRLNENRNQQTPGMPLTLVALVAALQVTRYHA